MLLAVRLATPACAAGLQDADRVGAEFLGLAKIPVKDFISGAPYDQWLDLVDRAGQPVMYADRVTKGSRQARLHMSITYRPVGVKVSSKRTCSSTAGGSWQRNSEVRVTVAVLCQLCLI